MWLAKRETPFSKPRVVYYFCKSKNKANASTIGECRFLPVRKLRLWEARMSRNISCVLNSLNGDSVFNRREYQMSTCSCKQFVESVKDSLVILYSNMIHYKNVHF